MVNTTRVERYDTIDAVAGEVDLALRLKRATKTVEVEEQFR
jgi:hypothetical protein